MVGIDIILNKNKAFETKISPQKSVVRKLNELSEELGIEQWYMISRNFIELEGIIYGFNV